VESLRLIGPVLLSVVTALWIDRATAVRGLTPVLQRAPRETVPSPEIAGSAASAAALRRVIAATGLGFVLYIGVFSPLGLLGQEIAVDLSNVPISRLFQLHMIFAVFIVFWYWVGFVPRPLGRDSSSFGRQLGLTPSRGGTTKERFRDAGRELGVGILAGIGGWLAGLSILLLVGSLIWRIGGDDALPAEPPATVAWIAALPWTVRLAISLSAGVVEEVFFRGLLQPRCGIALSTVLFVLAHAGYEQPIMLIGVTLLSLFFSALVVWRQSILAAIAAHTVFDAIQLLIVIPAILKYSGV